MKEFSVNHHHRDPYEMIGFPDCSKFSYHGRDTKIQVFFVMATQAEFRNNNPEKMVQPGGQTSAPLLCNLADAGVICRRMFVRCIVAALTADPRMIRALFQAEAANLHM